MKKSNSVEFIGTPSGEGEWFCWEVDEENFKKVTGRKISKFDYCLNKLVVFPTDIFEDGTEYDDGKWDGIIKLGKCRVKIEYKKIE